MKKKSRSWGAVACGITVFLACSAAHAAAAEAKLDELMTEVRETGVELKGLAPLLVDFPADLDGVPVYLCWLEGEAELAWYHRTDLGFAGRRRLP